MKKTHAGLGPEKLAAYKEDLFFNWGRLGRAVSHPVRLEILDLLCNAERSVEDLVHQTGRSHSNLSQHLSVLKDARLVTNRKEGLFVFYRLTDPLVGEFWQLFRQVAMRCMPDARDVYSRYAGETGHLSHLHIQQLSRRLEKGEVTVLDVRPEVEFRAGHIPGSLSIPLERLMAHLGTIPKDREVVVYCRGPYCLMAHEAVLILEHQGIRSFVLDEGILEWRAEGYPVESGFPGPDGGSQSAVHE